MDAERNGTPEAMLAVLACCARQYFRYSGTVPLGEGMSAGGFVGTTPDNHWFLFTVTLVRDGSITQHNKSNSKPLTRSQNQTIGQTFSASHVRHAYRTHVFTTGTAAGQETTIWKAQFEFRSDCRAVVDGLRGGKAFGGRKADAFPEFLDVVTKGLFRPLLLSGVEEEKNGKDVISSLFSNDEAMTFEVDRVKASLVADQGGDDGEQTQALFYNDLLDQAMGDEDGDEKAEMEDLLFLVKQFEKHAAQSK